MNSKEQNELKEQIEETSKRKLNEDELEDVTGGVGFISNAPHVEVHQIEDLRTDSDKPQIEIAQYLNLNREVYRRYEKGEREIPVWAVLKLADLYQTSTGYILGRTDRR